MLPVGATAPKNLSFRVIAATNCNLEEACAQGTFRFDLYSRLSVFELRVPPLRARAEDISLLAAHFLARFGGGSSYSLTTDAMEALCQHSLANPLLVRP